MDEGVKVDEGGKGVEGVNVVGGENDEDDGAKALLLLLWSLTPDDGRGVKGVLFGGWTVAGVSTGLKGSNFLVGSLSGISVGRLSASEK